MHCSTETSRKYMRRDTYTSVCGIALTPLTLIAMALKFQMTSERSAHHTPEETATLGTDSISQCYQQQFSASIEKSLNSKPINTANVKEMINLCDPE